MESVQQKDEWTSEQKAVLDRRYGPNCNRSAIGL